MKPSPQQTVIDKVKKTFDVDRILWHDYETFSEAPLLKVGASVYAEHHSTEILMGAYAFDLDDPTDWDRYAEEVGDIDTPNEPPQEYVDALTNPRVLKVAQNASFEYTIAKNVLGVKIPHNQTVDTMIMAYYLAFPGQLEKMGPLVGLPQDKQKGRAGKALIRTFSVPAKPTKTMPDRNRIWPWDKPDKWFDFREYNRQDIVSMRETFMRMYKFAPPMHIWEEWWEDREINERGVPVNRNMAVSAMKMYDEYMAVHTERLKDITGLANPNSRNQLLLWLQESEEYVFDNLTKASVAASLREEHLIPQNPDVKEALELRRELAKTSVTKYRRFRDCVCRDGTIKQTLQFGGASRTFRWGGRLIQPQNMKNPSDVIAEFMALIAKLIEDEQGEILELIRGDIMAALSEAIRGCIQSPEGYKIIDADLSAIENVVLGWVSGDEKILEVFRSGRDPYISFAVYMYKQPYEELWHEYKVLGNGKKRKVSKPPVLGAGYRLGAGHRFIDEKSGEEDATGLIGYAKNMGIDLTDEEATTSVKVWRETYKGAVKYWYKLEEAAFDTLKTQKPNKVGAVTFDVKGKFLRIKLPSGRHLHYYKAHIRKAKTPWGEMRDNVHYYGMKDGRWCLQSTHGGKLTENICQAIARDLLQHGMSLARKFGLDIFLHVHDQILALSEEERAEEELKILTDCMNTRPSWALDIPLSTGGFITTHMTKD